MLLALVVTPSGPASYAAPPAAAQDEVVSETLRDAVRLLPIAAETRAGYDRDRFRHWIDADGDCQDARDEVLAAESREATGGCDVTQGEWRSAYDGMRTEDPSELDIDHVVALAEAWDSGAKRWTRGTRTRFANDLGDPRSLIAVSASANRSKADRDPAEWLPELTVCRYLRHWVAVKLRWRLNVNRPERRLLVARAEECRDVVVTVRRATVRTRS